ncbi:MAG: glycoside hydrolase family 3 N-terminal domain-containing protein [Nostocaceae cyanobacterium]|nr:glycoside hydrolase family 3 N-terminal domain-containing protein [Nostocaceae cyanobacterium]
MVPLLPNIDSLSLSQQVAQMVVVRASGYLFDHQIQYPQWEAPAAKLEHWIKNLGVGGVILVGGSAGEIRLRTEKLQTSARIPLLISADIEEGVGQRFSGATWFAPPMALSAIFRKDAPLALDYAENMGAITAQEALAIGINWVLAPVVDVNNNGDNPVINVRAFGETTEEVSQIACAFIRGVQKHPVLTTVKHFPGHGDTTTDSHLDLPVILHSSERLAAVELPPFQAGIVAGVDAVMSAHLLIPSWDSENPATLSHTILTEQLRKTLGFRGLIVTDALVMGAIANRYGANEATVMAVEAGADILLMPVDPEGAIAAVCAAVESGRISLQRIRASVDRIWQAKSKLTTSPSNRDLTQELSQPHALSVATEILQQSQVIHGSVPLAAEKLINANFSNNTYLSCLRNLIVVDNRLTCDFLSHNSPAISLPQQKGYTTCFSDCYSQATHPFDGEHPTLLQLFIRGNPFRGNAGLHQTAQECLENLLKSGDLQALVVYGSPYVVQRFIPLLPTEIPCIFSYGQMPSAQALALNALFGV